MKKNFEFLEHSTDIKFIAYGKDLESCFENAAKAMFSSILDLNSINDSEKRTIKVKAENLDELLHDWLTELLFIFETENLAFKRFDVSIRKNRGYKISADVGGEILDNKYRINTEIKAVTYHDMVIEKTRDGWSAQVLCDI